MEYRGIQLEDSVNLYTKSGNINQTIKKGLDNLVERLKETGHILMSKYKGNKEKILINYQCEHEPNWVQTASYTSNKVGCPECAGNTPEQGKRRLIEALQANDHVLMSEYKGNQGKVFIDFKCGHEPHELVPYAYYNGVRCPKCSGVSPEQAKEDFYNKIKQNNHTALTEYKKANEKVLIDFNCSHEPHSITPSDYKDGKGCPICGKKKSAKTKTLKTEKAFRELAKKRDHVIVEYKGLEKTTLIDFKCGHGPQPIHANVYFYRNGGCTRCGGQSSEQAKEEFFALIEENKHQVLSEYKGSHKKILIDFQCGHEPNWTYPTTYKKGHECPECHFELISIKHSEQNRKEFPSLVESRGHKLLTPYGKNGSEKVLIDFKCGHDPKWIVPLNYKYADSGCLDCSRENLAQRMRLKSKENAKEFPSLVESNGHVLLTPYGKNNMEKVLIDFKCGHDPQLSSPALYKSGKRCLECARVIFRASNFKKGKKLLMKKLKENNHILLTEYTGAKEKILIDFQCKHEPHWITPDSYKSGSGCPKCSESKGEKIIREWLEENNINYVTQYMLPNKLWRYDFYIPSKNLIVEVQGLQHYKFVEYFHRTKENFYKQANNYNNKWAYARLKLGINFIEVNYKEGKPELALERFIEAYNEYRRIEESEKQLSLL